MLNSTRTLLLLSAPSPTGTTSAVTIRWRPASRLRTSNDGSPPKAPSNSHARTPLPSHLYLKLGPARYTTRSRQETQEWRLYQKYEVRGDNPTNTACHVAGTVADTPETKNGSITFTGHWLANKFHSAALVWEGMTQRNSKTKSPWQQRVAHAAKVRGQWCWVLVAGFVNWLQQPITNPLCREPRVARALGDDRLLPTFSRAVFRCMGAAAHIKFPLSPSPPPTCG